MASSVVPLVLAVVVTVWSSPDICYEFHAAKLYCTCEPSDVDVRAVSCVILATFPADDPLWHGFASFDKLRHVSLSSHEEGLLSYLPLDALRSSANALETLEIKYGHVLHVPPYAFLNSTSLVTLELSNNGIAALDRDAFAHLSALKELHLHENALTAVRRGVFVRLDALALLVLDRNRIRHVDDAAFVELVHLQELALAKNELRALSPGMFEGLGRLRRLDVGMNRIRHLTSGVFAKLLEVQQINLRENRLTTIEPGTFHGTAQLMVLYLNRNQLSRIDDDTFGHVPGLAYLDLRFNALSTLSERVVAPLRLRHNNASQVYLVENRLVCDCRIKWMLEMAKLKRHDDLNQWKMITCRPPATIDNQLSPQLDESVGGETADVDSDFLLLEDAAKYIESNKHCHDERAGHQARKSSSVEVKSQEHATAVPDSVPRLLTPPCLLLAAAIVLPHAFA